MYVYNIIFHKLIKNICHTVDFCAINNAVFCALGSMEWCGHSGKIYSLVWPCTSAGSNGCLLSTGPDGVVVQLLYIL